MARLTTILERYIIISWAVIAACLIVGLYWAFDRSPPFSIEDYSVLGASRGETAYVNAKVRRDAGRNCTVTYVRYLLDKDKVRHEISGVQYMTNEALRQMERDMPGELKLAVRIPDDTPIGQATLVTALEYRCNPVHALWPIEILLEMKLEVKP